MEGETFISIGRKLLQCLKFMSTRHVILALLDIKPMSGYDLFQNLKISVHSLWSATYGQIYPTLHKLEAEALVTSETLPSGKKRERIVYSLTEAGKNELHTWINSPVTYLPFRDPFRLWATYVDVADKTVALTNIDHHITLNNERAVLLDGIADQIETSTHPLIQVREERLSDERVTLLKQTRALIFRELAHQARNEVESAQRIREYVIEVHEQSD